jgi:hypothetical protein
LYSSSSQRETPVVADRKASASDPVWSKYWKVLETKGGYDGRFL